VGWELVGERTVVVEVGTVVEAAVTLGVEELAGDSNLGAMHLEARGGRVVGRIGNPVLGNLG